MWIFVYALRDPRDGLIKYVGKANDPKKRLRRHVVVRHDGDAKAAWVRELYAQDLRPQLEILQKVPVAGWQDAEKCWIAKLSPQFNTLVGGNGGAGKARYESPSIQTVSQMLNISPDRWRFILNRATRIKSFRSGRCILDFEDVAEVAFYWVRRLLRKQKPA